MTILTESTLDWPENVSRTSARKAGTFRTSFAAAYQRVHLELGRMRVSKATISGYLILNTTGNARADQPRVGDTAIVVHFVVDRRRFVLPMDLYTTREANMQAIALVLEAYRTIERHGLRRLLLQALEGFRALVPGQILALPATPWYRVLGFPEPPATLKQAVGAYRKMLENKGHPDHGGEDETFRAAATAIAEAREHFGKKKAS